MNRICTVAAAVLASGLAVAQAHGQIVITEIMNNPSQVSDTNGEWFEVLNIGPDPVDMDGWTIRDLGITPNIEVITNGGPLIIESGGVLVFGRNGDQFFNGGVEVDYVLFSTFLSNADDEIVLVDPSGSVIDEVAYDGGPIFPDTAGASMELLPQFYNTVDNDFGFNWQLATTPYGDGDLGTPGEVTLFEPLITQQPIDRIAIDQGGAPVTLVASAAGAEFTQWFLDGVLLSDGPVYSGANTGSLQIQPDLAAAGFYFARFQSAFGGAVNSDATLVAVRPAAGASQADVTTTGATLEGFPGFGVPDSNVDLDDLGFFLNIWLLGTP